MKTPIRNVYGDLTVAIVALAILSAVVVAGVSSYSQFDIVRKDLVSSTENTKSMILNRVKNDLTETIIEQNPAGAQAILDGILADAQNFARDGLSPASSAYLTERNPGDLSLLFNDSVLDLNGNIITIIVAARAKVSIVINTEFQTRTKPISGTLKELIAIGNNGASFDCGADCGSCGQCDQSTNRCIGVKKTIDNIIHIPDDPVSGKFDCKPANETLNGQKCIEYGGTVEVDGSCTLPGNCKFKEGVYSWNDHTSASTADVYYNSIKIGDAIDITLTELEADAGAGNKNYVKDELFPFANNFTNPDSPIYAVCEEDLVNHKIAFATSGMYSGNLVQEASNLGLGIFDPATDGIEAANALCQMHASAGGLSGTYIALLNTFSTAGGMYFPIALTDGVGYQNTNGDVINENGFFDSAAAQPRSLSNYMDYDENGTKIIGTGQNPSLEIGAYVFTGYQGPSSGFNCNMTKFAPYTEGWNTSCVASPTASCGTLVGLVDPAWFGGPGDYSSGGFGPGTFTGHPWYQASSPPCNRRLRLYCIENPI